MHFDYAQCSITGWKEGWSEAETRTVQVALIKRSYLKVVFCYSRSRPVRETVKFEVPKPFGFTVRTSENYCQRLITKHPDIEDLEELVQQALTSPDEIQRIKRMQSREGNQYGTDKSFL